jgi:hypothetical protein
MGARATMGGECRGEVSDGRCVNDGGCVSDGRHVSDGGRKLV